MATILPPFVYNGKTYAVDESLKQFRCDMPGEAPAHIDFASRVGQQMMAAWIEQEMAAGRERNKGVTAGSQLVIVRHLWIFTHPEQGDRPEYPQGKRVWALARGEEFDPDASDSVIIVDSPLEVVHPPNMPFACPVMYLAPLSWWEHHQPLESTEEAKSSGVVRFSFDWFSDQAAATLRQAQVCHPASFRFTYGAARQRAEVVVLGHSMGSGQTVDGYFYHQYRLADAGDLFVVEVDTEQGHRSALFAYVDSRPPITLDAPPEEEAGQH